MAFASCAIYGAEAEYKVAREGVRHTRTGELTFTDQNEALEFLATMQPPVTISVYEAGTKTVRYQALSVTLAHARFVIEQVLGAGCPGDLIVTLRTG